MGLADFKKIVPYFNDVETVILQGWGEPLLHKDLVPIIRAAKRGWLDDAYRTAGPAYRPPAVGFVTSGKGLNAQRSAELMDAGIDFIGFSFAGSSAKTHESIRINSDFGELTAAVQAFTDRARTRGRIMPQAHIVCLILRDNLHELPDLPRLARDIGIREIVLTNLVHVTTAWQEAQRVFSCGPDDDAGKMLEETADQARRYGINIRYPVMHAHETALCEENPLKTVYISPAGDVSPCVYLLPPSGSPFKRIYCGREHEVERLSFGNIFKTPFDRIRESCRHEEFQKAVAARARALGIAASGFFARDASKAGMIMPVPDPPKACRTCHKMLGV
jgi:MoaA/NifB/PqqE/SkfB family radical SAM enzyme